MFETDAPRTLAEAKKYRYHQWAGNSEGWPYEPKQCAFEVWTSGMMLSHRQCSKKPGYGPGKLYCKQHAKWIEGAEGDRDEP
jgi:hypothetical protein